MHYYIPQMLPEYVEVEPHIFQPYCDATVAGWRNEQRLATQQGKHQRPGVTQMGSACRQAPDCRERAAAPVFGKAGRPEKVQVPVRSLKPRRATKQNSRPSGRGRTSRRVSTRPTSEDGAVLDSQTARAASAQGAEDLPSRLRNAT
jgi:hypothetical protein